MLVFDFLCPSCSHVEHDRLVEHDEVVHCYCGAVMTRLASAPHVFSTIIPTYPGSDRLKAGGVHKAQRQPATKTQIGYGGGQSPENPKGGK